MGVLEVAELDRGARDVAQRHGLPALVAQPQRGHRRGEANALHRLGDSLRATGDEPGARDSWERALRIFDELGHRDAEVIRAKLAPLPVGS